MKLKKVQVLLFIHEKLLTEKEVNPAQIKEMFELEDKTFYRYIQELKAYFANMFKTEKIVYCKSKKMYYLK